MKVQAVLAFLAASMTIASCGSPPACTCITAHFAPNLTGNWQIQSNVTAGTVPVTGIVLFGALESTGYQVSGTFRFTNLSQPTTCGLNQTVTVSGIVDSSNNLALTSAQLANGNTIKIALAITRAEPPYSGTGAIEVDGASCAFPSAASIGEEITSASGTYSGTLSPGTLVSPGTGTPATASLLLNQSASPTADGQFAATGTFNYAIGTCLGSVSLGGVVSGVGVTLSSASGSPNNPQVVSFVGTVTPSAAAISAGLLQFAPAPCSTDPTSTAIYSGQLNHQ